MMIDELLSNLNETQRAAAKSRQEHIAVTAGAGTGKTRTLVARYLSLLAGESPLMPRRIVAVTFTRKAAREMRNRVREEVQLMIKESQAHWDAVLTELDAARIDTIHTLCADILRTHPAEAGVDPYFVVLDEQQSAQLKRDAIEQALNWAAKDEDAAALFTDLSERNIRDLAWTMMANRDMVREIVESTRGLDWLAFWQEELAQRQAAELIRLVNSPVFKVAVAVLEDNEAYDSDDLIEAQRMNALSALKWKSAPFTDAYASLSELQNIKLRGGAASKWPGGKEQLQEVRDALKCVKTLWQEADLIHVTPRKVDTTHARLSPQMLRMFEQATSFYEEAKGERAALDFDDLELMAARLLRIDEVRSYWQEQVQALLVDEYQDTNARQNDLLRQLVRSPATRFLVGDRKQSIYGFRGADVSVFEQEKRAISDSGNGGLFDLDTSYRSHPALLEMMNALLRPALGDVAARDETWRTPFEPLSAPTGREDRRGYVGPRLEFHLAKGNKAVALSAAAAGLADRIRVLCSEGSPFHYGDVAILCRAASAFAYYEDALDAAGIPYVTVAGKGFYDRPEIRDLLNALRAIEDPQNDVALVGFLRSPAVGLTDESIFHLMRGRVSRETTLWDAVNQNAMLDDPEQAIRLQSAVDLLQTLHQEAGRVSVADILKRLLDQTHYPAIVREAGQTRALANINKLMADVHHSGLVSVSRFIEWADQLRTDSAGEGEARAEAGNAVQIMTIHKAKGLEFPVVVLGDAGNDGNSQPRPLADARLGVVMPMKDGEGKAAEAAAAYQMAALEAQRKEEAEHLRLLYVALTRAEELVMISGYGSPKFLEPPKDRDDCQPREKSWLKMLLGITRVREQLGGTDAAAIDRLVSFNGADVRVCVYPADGNGPDTRPRVDRGKRDASSIREYDHRMLEPLSAPTPPAELATTPNRVWRVVGIGRNIAPAWVVGKLFHDAVALWYWPGEMYDGWARSQAKAYGLIEDPQVTDAVNRARIMLERLKNHELYQAIDKADRRLQEVPFNLMEDGRVVNGYIDLLYRKGDVWTVVDFKTDSVRPDWVNPYSQSADYKSQVRAYGRAVRQMVGVEAELKLCYLDYGGAIKVEVV